VQPNKFDVRLQLAASPVVTIAHCDSGLGGPHWPLGLWPWTQLEQFHLLYLLVGAKPLS